jgi:predicted nucleic acid-binding protein
MSNRALVLDANILIRAVLGTRVRRILETTLATYRSFFVPELALSEAQEHLATLVANRGAMRQRRFACWMPWGPCGFG